MLVLSDADVRAVLAPGECEQAMVRALRADAEGSAHTPLRTVMTPPRAEGFMGIMPAHAAGDPGSFAVKTVCLMAANPRRGLDIHQGVVTLFDGASGIPTAVLNAAAITEIRTAAVTAAATRALAVPEARVLAILGAGVQGAAHLRALADARAWEQVRVYAPTRAHAQALVQRAPELTDGGAAGAGPEVIAVSGAREAVAGADVVVTVTSSREPVLEHGWLADRAHVNAVGASSPTARELPVATVAAAGLFCDSRESLRHEALEFRMALESGAIAGEDHVRGELGEVLRGTVGGRTEQDGVTVFRSLGLGIEDLEASRLAVATARRVGVGTEVAL